MLTRSFETFAAASYQYQRSLQLRVAFGVLMALAMGALFFARPRQIEAGIVRSIAIGDLGTQPDGQYVKVSGMLNPDPTFQRYFRLATAYGSGYSGFVPLADPGASKVIQVEIDGLGAYGDNQASVLVGHVERGADGPPIYLVVGEPPRLRLARLLSDASAAVLLIGSVLTLLAVALRRAQYTLPALWDAPGHHAGAEAPALLWYGDLGRGFDDAMVRAEPARFVANIHEGRFESSHGAGLWSVSIRRLRRAHLFDVATRFGALPAMRMYFEDERGLTRVAVLAVNTAAARGALIELLGLIRNG